MSTTDAVLNEVQAIIAETLGTEPEEIIPQAHWEMDLDGESIDLLDLSFRLEKQLGVKIKIPSPATDDLELDDKGFLTRASLDVLQKKYPFLELQDWESQPFTKALDLITIGAIMTLVKQALVNSENRAAHSSPHAPA